MNAARETLVYGLPRGESERWTESLLLCRASATPAEIEAVKKAAAADGWHSFRVAGFVPGTMPDFAAAVSGKARS